jgi:hypothetical protein
VSDERPDDELPVNYSELIKRFGTKTMAKVEEAIEKLKRKEKEEK